MSSQVEFSTNYIEIKRMVSTTNEKGENSDSVDVVINHRMKPANVKYIATYEGFNPLGGIELRFKSNCLYQNISIDSTRLFSIYNFLYRCLEMPQLNKEIPEKGCLSDIIKRYRDELYQYRPNLAETERKLLTTKNALSEKDSVELMDALQYIFASQRSLYWISYMPPKRNTFLPIDIYKEDEWHYAKGQFDDYHYGVKSKAFMNIFVNPNWLKSGIDKEKIEKELDSRHLTCYDYFVGNSNVPYKDRDHQTRDSMVFLNLNSSDSLFNYVDYFTSSDMSQRIFVVSFCSQVPLSGIAITFDESIIISDIYPKPDRVDMNQIVYTDRKKLDYFRNRSLHFHAKLPTYENKQLIRSLVLTTILTAVFSLFCTNLYLCGRGLLRRFIKERDFSDVEKEKYKKRISFYHWTIVAIVVLISAIPLLLYYWYLSNDKLLLKSDSIVKIILTIVLIIVVLIVAIHVWKIKLIPKTCKKV